MSDYDIEYCPWCGGDIEPHIERFGHKAFHAHLCNDCDTVFNVSVPHSETQVRWTNV